MMKGETRRFDSVNNSIGKGEEEVDLFREALVRRHVQNLMHLRSTGQELRDRKAEGFGRCLRAARTSKGLTYGEVARRADIPTGNLRALESGVYLAEDIKLEWVEKLADALDEDANLFYFVLGKVREEELVDEDVRRQLAKLIQKLEAIEKSQREIEEKQVAIVQRQRGMELLLLQIGRDVEHGERSTLDKLLKRFRGEKRDSSTHRKADREEDNIETECDTETEREDVGPVLELNP